ncbi:MAG: Txe/YoeB family addiction module toxin [Bacteroidales bacterium]|jgi:toxin YoeB|nr:Txe/YoeB family addiction module toxin [Bacteroidales bacterium]
MKYSVYLSKKAEEQLDFFLKVGDVSRLKKIHKLLAELEDHPTTGTGKPEVLKGDLFGYYSRRIDGKNRMIYSINNQTVVVDVLSLKGHYGEK